jgi:RimJ/RimL family protein N-acetyltransferase
MQLDLGEHTIRNWHPDDAAALARHADNRAVWRHLRDAFPHPYTAEAARSWIGFARGQEPETHFAIASPREAIGGIGVRLGEDVFRLSGEIGYWLGEAFWGRGIATRAVLAFTAEAFSRFALERLWAGVFEWNLASARVLEKAGYTREGTLRRAVFKDGRIGDQLLYARLRPPAR